MVISAIHAQGALLGLTGIDGTVAFRLVVSPLDFAESSSVLAAFQELFAGVTELPATTVDDLEDAGQPLLAWLQEDPTTNTTLFLEDPIHVLLSVDSIRSRIGKTTRELLGASAADQRLSPPGGEATGQILPERPVGTSPSQSPRDAIVSWLTDNEDHFAQFLENPEKALREAHAAVGVAVFERPLDAS